MGFSPAGWRGGLAAVGLWVVVLVGNSHAQNVPALINYQGQIANPDGTTPPTADYVISFTIFDAPSGGKRVWGPQIFDGQTGPGHGVKIPVVQGYFNVMLGSVDIAGASITSAFDQPQRFVELQIGGGAPISRRQQLLGVPYAFRAGNASLADKAILADRADTAGKLSAPIDVDALGAAVAERLVPPGTIVAFGGDTNKIPAGWLLCNGAALVSSQFPRLYSAIGTAWGDASEDNDATTDFRLPDCRGLFLRGANLNKPNPEAAGDPDRQGRVASAIGGNAQNQVGSLQPHALERHDHGGVTGEGNVEGTNPFRDFVDTPVAQQNPLVFAYQRDRAGYARPLSQHTHNISPSGNSTETRPSNVYVNYIIKR